MRPAPTAVAVVARIDLVVVRHAQALERRGELRVAGIEAILIAHIGHDAAVAL
jgi:hypothetical protein